MTVRIWGVRGSSPTPLAPEEIRNKFASILQRVRPSDLENPDSRQLFLSNLPPELFGTVGGNTACVEVRTADDTLIILDTGTGLRELERRVMRMHEGVNHYHIFMSHFHYDHLIGLPYFGAMYDPSTKVTFYSPYPNMEEILVKYLVSPYHPVGWDSFRADIEFRILKRNEILSLGNARIDWIKRNHPNGSISYKIMEQGHSFIYSTDTELTDKEFQRFKRNLEYFQNTDVIILDAQYTLGEAIERYNWGHTSYSLAVEFAREFSIGKLYLFHHDPKNSDATMEDIVRSAREFDSKLAKNNKTKIFIDIAREGHEIHF